MPGNLLNTFHVTPSWSYRADRFDFLGRGRDRDDDGDDGDDADDGGHGRIRDFDLIILKIEYKIAAKLAAFGERVAEKTGNYDLLKKALAKLDDAEDKAIDLGDRVPDRLLERIRDKVEDANSTLTEANQFRKAPDFDGSHIDWIIGQNVEVYEDATSKGFLSEGNIDYFNLNAGSGSALIGENTGFTGNNNVTASMAAAARDGGVITLGFELTNFGPEGPAAGIAIVAGYWDMFVAGEIDDLPAFLAARAAAGDIQAETITAFLDILAEFGPDIPEIHFRPGYEFDADFNGLNPEDYIKTFKFLATLFQDDDAGLGLDNVQMVWQSQSGAERSPVDIYDEANGAPAPITKQDVFDHLDLWYPGDEFVDIVGMSLFQTEESARNWMFADGEANDGLAVMDDFDLFLQAFADYAIEKGKKLDISEASPAGAYLDRDYFNERVAEQLASDPDAPIRFLEEGEIAYAKFHIDDDPDAVLPTGVELERFFDESDPNFYIGTAAQIWNDYFVPFFQFVERNAEVVDSINMISYNWDEIPLFESIKTDTDPETFIGVNFGSGNWFDNPELAPIINDYVVDVFG